MKAELPALSRRRLRVRVGSLPPCKPVPSFVIPLPVRSLMTALSPLETKSLSLRALNAEEIPDQEEVTAKTARTFGVLRVPSPFLSSRLAAHGGQTKIAPAHRTRLNSGVAGAPRTSCSGCNPSIDTTTFMWACVAQLGARGLKPLVTTWTCIPRSSSSGVSSSSSRHRTSGSPPTIGR